MKIRNTVTLLTLALFAASSLPALAIFGWQWCETPDPVDGSGCPSVVWNDPYFGPNCNGGFCVKTEYDGPTCGGVCVDVWIPWSCTVKSKTTRYREYDTINDCKPGQSLGGENEGEWVCYCGDFDPTPGPWHRTTCNTCG
jgi:hypothetical protein